MVCVRFWTVVMNAEPELSVPRGRIQRLAGRDGPDGPSADAMGLQI